VGFKVIHSLESAEGPLPLKQIAQSAGMSASKAYLYLATFEAEGLVKQDRETGYYGLGPSAIQLGLAAIRQLDVVRLAREQLDRLHALTQCAAYISIWGNRGPVIASKVDGLWQGSMVVRVGYVLPLLHSSTGRIFHAYLPKSETRKLVENELNGGKGHALAPLSKSEIDKSAAEIRSLGYAMSENQVNIGFASVSAPVFDYSQRLAGTLTVLGPSAVLNKNARRDAAHHLREAAATMCVQMGGNAPSVTAPPGNGKPSKKLDTSIVERVALPEG
jgi:DNA-binding IclR family transcriptional regulator